MQVFTGQRVAGHARSLNSMALLLLTVVLVQSRTVIVLSGLLIGLVLGLPVQAATPVAATPVEGAVTSTVVSAEAAPVSTNVALLPSSSAMEMEGRIRELTDSLAAAQQRIEVLGVGPVHRGRLEELERKALAFDSASVYIASKDQAVEKLKQELNQTRREVAGLRLEIDRLTVSNQTLATVVAITEKERAAVQESLDLVRMGKYEYYEVREGDTCETIAAQPSIYNDKTRHVLIRQANRGNVPDMDKLLRGQVLIIPRLPAGTKHEL
jgi:nucleoid-associated protein YgaU